MANPPVCRIMDYGKFRYEEAQKAKEARRKSIHVTVKEVKFRPKIGKGDFDTKMRHLIEFLEEGHKVKVTLQFRGREMAHPELGRKILDDVIVAVGPSAKVENQARMEGRSMSLVLAPDKKAQDAIKKAAQAERDAADTPVTDNESNGTPSTDPADVLDEELPDATEPDTTEPDATESDATESNRESNGAPSAEPADILEEEPATTTQTSGDQ